MHHLLLALVACRITRHYKASLNPDLVCLTTQDHMRWWILPAVFGSVTLVLIVWRCARGPIDEEPEKPGSRRISLGGHTLASARHRAY